MTNKASAQQTKGAGTQDRNLAMELVRVAEAAAIAASEWVGFGEKNIADGAAVDAMRAFLHTVHMDGTVVIGEGEKDQAPMLYNGERVGDGLGPKVDVAVDPIDGTTLTAMGYNNALSVMAVANVVRCMTPRACSTWKNGCRSEAADLVDLRLPVKQNLLLLSKALDKKVSQLNVCPGPATSRRSSQRNPRGWCPREIHYGRRCGRRYCCSTPQYRCRYLIGNRWHP